MAEEKMELRVPDPMTEPCSRYFWEQHQLIEFLRLISVNYQTVIDFTSSSTQIILAVLFYLLKNLEYQIDPEYQIDKVVLDLEASNKIKKEIEKIKMLTTKFLSGHPESRRRDMENIIVKLDELFNDKNEFEIKHGTSNITVSNESELKKLTSDMMMSFENTLDELGITTQLLPLEVGVCLGTARSG